MSSALQLAVVPPSLFSQDEWQLVQGTVARLNQSQLYWLSGYLAGGHAVAGTTTLAPSVPGPAVHAEPPVLIAYGGETGNSKALAARLRQLAEKAAVPARVQDLARIRVRQLAKERKLIIICSTHGDGDPPETIGQFHDDLAHAAPGSLQQLQYAVLALGDSSYEKFCQTGRDLDLYLEQAGARRLQAREECDVDFEKPATQWMTALMGKFATDHATAGRPALAIASTAAEAPAAEAKNGHAAYSKNNPCFATVLETVCLSHHSRQEKIWHLEIEADDAIELLPGDAVGILPRNSTALIEQIIDAAKLDRNHQVLSNGATKTVFEALQDDCDLVIAGKNLLDKWPSWNSGSGLQDILALDATAQRHYLKSVQLRDLLEQFPIQPDAADFVAHLRPLQPRLYDVANFRNDNAGEIHLLLKQYRYWFNQRTESGVASDYLANIANGARLRMYPHHNPRFRLAGASASPLILLAEGTGIAPYRAFLEQLRAEGSDRPCWLVFLEMQYEQDFLYQTEWQQAVTDRLVTWFDGVFVRDEPTSSLQQRVLREGARFMELMQRGAHVYFCGDRTLLTACETALAAYHDTQLRKQPAPDMADWKQLGKTSGRIHRNLY